MPQDIMHILLEGVIPYEVTLMLTDFVIDRKYLSPSQLNDRIQCFSFTNQEAKDKLSPIVFSSQGIQLSQTGYLQCISNFNVPLLFLFHVAAQMWNLVIHLPLMIGDTVPPDDKKCGYPTALHNQNCYNWSCRNI